MGGASPGQWAGKGAGTGGAEADSTRVVLAARSSSFATTLGCGVRERPLSEWEVEGQAAMVLRAVVFDLDGVLALPSLFSALDRVAEELVLPR